MPRVTNTKPVAVGPAKRKTRQMSTENPIILGHGTKNVSPDAKPAVKKRAILGNVTNDPASKLEKTKNTTALIKPTVAKPVPAAVVRPAATRAVVMARPPIKLEPVVVQPAAKASDVRRSDRIKNVKEEPKPALRNNMPRKVQENKTALAKKAEVKPVVLPKPATLKPVPVIKKAESPEVYFDAVEDSRPSTSAYNTPATSSRSEQSESLFYSVLGSSKPDEAERKLPEGVEDFDKELEKDVYAASAYAMDIFLYFKEREVKFALVPYMPRHPELTVHMRAILVDWMIEVQENFELNHESLYMAVKLMDLFLSKSKRPIAKDLYQLLGVTCVFISTKFEERSPPLIEDFLYICEDAYTREELIEMEEEVLQSVDFDIGFPLSYSFLRRFSRTAKHTMMTLTLARYFLESSLLDYRYSFKSESKMAAASLLLAVKITKETTWTPSLVYYSGYKEQELKELTLDLAVSVPRYSSEGLQNVLKKYQHPAFFEVAKNEIPKNLTFEGDS